MTQDMNADYVSSPQAAKILRITYVGVAQLARQGKIPAVKIANRWLIPRAFLEEFAQTYEGRRGRPRKKAQFLEQPGSTATIEPERLGLADAGSEVMGIRPADGAVPASKNLVDQHMGTPDFAAQSGSWSRATPVQRLRSVSPRARLARLWTRVRNWAQWRRLRPVWLSRPNQESRMLRLCPRPRIPEPKQGKSRQQMPMWGIRNILAVHGSAGRTGTTVCRLGVGDRGFQMRSGPDLRHKRPGLPSGQELRLRALRERRDYGTGPFDCGPAQAQDSLSASVLVPLDYRYEHLNVDIHGVDHAVVDWWTMGENGYTGHLPMKLGGPGHAFEANIWLP